MFTDRISRRFLLIPLLGGSLLLFNCRGGCGDRGGNPHKRADKIVERMEKGLNLTADQTTRIRQLAYEIADSIQVRGRETMEGGAHGEFLKQLRSAAVDTAALNQDMGNREAEFQKRAETRRANMIRMFTQLHDILTPEQREKLATFLEKHRDEMRKQWGSVGK